MTPLYNKYCVKISGNSNDFGSKKSACSELTKYFNVSKKNYEDARNSIGGGSPAVIPGMMKSSSVRSVSQYQSTAPVAPCSIIRTESSHNKTDITLEIGGMKSIAVQPSAIKLHSNEFHTSAGTTKASDSSSSKSCNFSNSRLQVPRSILGTSSDRSGSELPLPFQSSKAIGTGDTSTNLLSGVSNKFKSDTSRSTDHGSHIQSHSRFNRADDYSSSWSKAVNSFIESPSATISDFKSSDIKSYVKKEAGPGLDTSVISGKDPLSDTTSALFSRADELRREIISLCSPSASPISSSEHVGSSESNTPEKSLIIESKRSPLLLLPVSNKISVQSPLRLSSPDVHSIFIDNSSQKYIKTEKDPISFANATDGNTFLEKGKRKTERIPNSVNMAADAVAANERETATILNESATFDRYVTSLDEFLLSQLSI